MSRERESASMNCDLKPTQEELLAVARSYYDWREDLVYSVKGNTFLCGGDLTDQEHGGKGRIDCSTLVHLVLQGIPFERSPYVSGDPQDFLRRARPGRTGRSRRCFRLARRSARLTSWRGISGFRGWRGRMTGGKAAISCFFRWRRTG